MDEADIRFLTGDDIEISPKLAEDIPGALPRALLTLLVLKAGQWVSRDYLAGILWPDTDQASARHRLRATLFNLRQRLGPPLERSLEATAEKLILRVPADNVDILRFSELARRSTSGASEAAVNLYKGDFLSGFPTVSPEFDALLAVTREEARRSVLSLCLQLLQQSSDSGDLMAFESRLSTALKLDRTNAEVSETALRHFARYDQPRRFDESFETYSRALTEDLDAEPDAEFLALRDRLKSEMAKTTAPRPEPPARAAPGLSAVPPGPVAPRKSPRRKSLKVSYRVLWMAAAIMAITGALGWVIYGKFIGDRGERGPIFLVQSYDGGAATCGESWSDADYEQATLQALRRIRGSNVILGDAGAIADLQPEGVYALEQTVICSGTLLRATLTLIRHSTSKIEWVGRYEVSIDELSLLSDRISTDLKSALSR